MKRIFLSVFYRYVTISRYGRVIGKGWLTLPRAIIIVTLIYIIVPILHLPTVLFQEVC